MCRWPPGTSQASERLPQPVRAVHALVAQVVPARARRGRAARGGVGRLDQRRGVRERPGRPLPDALLEHDRPRARCRPRPSPRTAGSSRSTPGSRRAAASATARATGPKCWSRWLSGVPPRAFAAHFSTSIRPRAVMLIVMIRSARSSPGTQHRAERVLDDALVEVAVAHGQHHGADQRVAVRGAQPGAVQLQRGGAGGVGVAHAVVQPEDVEAADHHPEVAGARVRPQEPARARCRGEVRSRIRSSPRRWCWTVRCGESSCAERRAQRRARPVERAVVVRVEVAGRSLRPWARSTARAPRAGCRASRTADVRSASEGARPIAATSSSATSASKPDALQHLRWPAAPRRGRGPRSAATPRPSAATGRDGCGVRWWSGLRRDRSSSRSAWLDAELLQNR